MFQPDISAVSECACLLQGAIGEPRPWGLMQKNSYLLVTHVFIGTLQHEQVIRASSESLRLRTSWQSYVSTYRLRNLHFDGLFTTVSPRCGSRSSCFRRSHHAGRVEKKYLRRAWRGPCGVISPGYAALYALTSLGKVNWKVAPGPELDVAHKRPPCDSMMDRLIGNPMPVP